MASYTTLITQAGQTVADIALQAYGAPTVAAMNALVADNPAVFHEGIATLVAAGVPIKYRVDVPFMNKQTKAYYEGNTLNSTYKSASGGIVNPPEEDEIVNPPSLTQIVVGKRDNWRIELHVAFKESEVVFGGSIVILANGVTAEAAIAVDYLEDTEFDPLLSTQLSARYSEDNIILLLNTEAASIFKYKIISAI